MTDLATLSARAAAARIAAGTFSAEAYAAALLARIAAAEPEVQAWQFLDPELALAQARDRDRAGVQGPLHGLPVGIKDVIDTADMPTGYGSRLYAGHRPAADAACVAFTRAAGGIVLGKTVSTEFAFRAPGRTRNPHRAGHTPGGSSSGSAAAVAAGMVPLAFGTQTAGSVIRPASYCGVVGYKPSFGLIDRTGVKTLATSFDTVGVFARSVADAALLVAATAHRPALAAVAALPAPRIGVYRPPYWQEATPATEAALGRAAAALAGSGARVRDVPPRPEEAHHLDWHDGVMDWDVLNAFAFERLFHLAELAAPTQEQIALMAARSTLARFEAARAGMQAAQAAFAGMLGDHDVLLTAAAPGEAPAGLGSTGDAVFNRAWTMLHAPCVTVPTGPGPGGLPVGVQLVGRIGDDARTLAAAAALEAALEMAPGGGA